MSELDGKVALITGASAGLGAVTAQLFAERGASVFGIARDADRMATVFEEVPGGKYASVDIADPAACRQAVADCVDAFGRLDVLANVAGFHQMRHTPTMTDDDWDRDLAVNLNGPFYLCRAALPISGIRRQHRQRVVHRGRRGRGLLRRLLRGQARTDRTDPRAGRSSSPRRSCASTRSARAACQPRSRRSSPRPRTPTGI